MAPIVDWRVRVFASDRAYLLHALRFVENVATEDGGVVSAQMGTSVNIQGGYFFDNYAHLVSIGMCSFINRIQSCEAAYTNMQKIPFLPRVQLTGDGGASRWAGGNKVTEVGGMYHRLFYSGVALWGAISLRQLYHSSPKLLSEYLWVILPLLPFPSLPCSVLSQILRESV